jgi:hypothetical protein
MLASGGSERRLSPTIDHGIFLKSSFQGRCTLRLVSITPRTVSGKLNQFRYTRPIGKIRLKPAQGAPMPYPQGGHAKFAIPGRS